MIVNVTSLGSGSGGARASVSNIVRYLEGNGREPAELTKAGSSGIQLDLGSAGGYYADSGVGRWIGEGTNGAGFGLRGNVDRAEFERLLLGQNPNTGEALMHSVGSARRSSDANTEHKSNLTHTSASPGHSPANANSVRQDANRMQQSALHPPADTASRSEDSIDLVTFAADHDIDDSYLRRIVHRTEKEVTAQTEAERSGMPIPELSDTHLHASKQGRSWTIDTAEAERFIAERKTPQVVHGYDITFSVPKSVSVLWAAADPEMRQVIEEGLHKSVDAGMAYLEDEGFWTRAGRGENRADGLTAAAYTHETSRAMEPQLHTHVVVPNMAWTADRKVQAVDARGFYAHATPAGHLADAVMRNHLTQHLGVEWTAVEKGSAEIVGVPREAMRVMSSRRAAVIDLAEEVGSFSAHGRQVAALVTRPSKEQGADEADLKAGWVRDLADAGLDAAQVRSIAPGPGHQHTQHFEPRSSPEMTLGSGPLSDRETSVLFSEMSGPEGVTKFASVFDRRDVIGFSADAVGTRLDPQQIIAVADKWLALSAVPLEITNTWDTVGKAGSGRVAISRDQVYSTPEIVELEQRVIHSHTRGLDAGQAQVRPAVAELAIGLLESKLGSELGPDQAAAVRAITTSGHQFQAVEGLAGAGKTTAMTAAVDAWQEAGYRVVGGAPFGAAAQKLGDEVGIEARTVASLLQNIDYNGPSAVLDPKTVLLIDEASTISNRQLDSLYWAVEEAGATMRTVGDPQQHSAVEASGLWKELVKTNGESSPVLDVNRRQNPETMGAVREGLATWRTGDRDAAMSMLEADGRFFTADSWPEVMDCLTEAWLPHHTKATEEGTVPLQMISERNRDRTELNSRAQAMLRERGLIGEGVQIGDTSFHINDRVVSQVAEMSLKAPNARARDHVLNGSTGVIKGFTGPASAPNLLVDFERLGTIEVPHRFVEIEIGVGRGGGLAPAYAVTSYKAEGQTYEAALGLAAPGSIDKEGMYVALTRGKEDLQVFSIDPNKTWERADAEFAAPADPRTMTEALRADLNREGRPELAATAEPGIAAALAPNSASDRGQRLGEHQVAANAVAEPNHLMVAAIGERPERIGAHQQVWDQAVTDAAIYEHRYGPQEWQMSGVPMPPTAVSQEQRSSHQDLAASMTAARHAAVAQTPLGDLLSERRSLGNRSHSQTEAVHRVALNDASNQLRTATSERDRVQAQVEGQRRPSQPTLDHLAKLSQRVEVATSTRDAALQAVASYQIEGKPEGMRASTIDSAINWRIEKAVERPARYLVDALGERPAKGAERVGWNKNADLIETARHRAGLEPKSGPLPGVTPLQKAIGTGPNLAVVAARIARTLKDHSPTRDHDRGRER